MINVTLPEIILLETLQSAIKFVRQEYADQSDKTQSYLYKLLNGAIIEKYDLFTQAVQVICGADDSPRLFKIDLMFNAKRDHVPSAHITLPSEMTGQGNGMGTDEGYANYIEEAGDIGGQFNGDFGDDYAIGTEGTVRRAVLSRRISATYNIVIMSDNTNEVVLIYHFLRAILIALIPHLHIKGLSNVSFGGQDLQPYEGLGHNLHMRAITISLQYDTFVPSIFVIEMGNDVIADGVPKTDEEFDADTVVP